MSVHGPNCARCSFEHTGTIFIPPDGSGLNGVLILGDSGWEYEARALRGYDVGVGSVGTPFAGPSGWWMDRQFKRLNVSREDFRIANSIWCKTPRLGLTDHPEKHPEAAAAIKHCSPYLDALVAAEKPRAIVTMGAAALHRATGLHDLTKCHGYVLDSPWGIPVIPAYHPSFILHGNQKMTGAWCYIIQKALDIASGKAAPKRDYNLLLDPNVGEAARYLGWDEDGLQPSDLIVCDIETNESPSLPEDETGDIGWEIVRISFSNKAGAAISMPWRSPYKEQALLVLGLAKRVVFWNQAFDVPRLIAAGAIIPGQIIDAMWAWHFLQSDLPKALGFVAPLLLNTEPWKHLSSIRPAYYSALDSAITMDLWLEIERLLKAEGHLDAFHRQCTAMLPINKAMTDAGMLIDTKAQRKLIDVKLTAERDTLFTTIQSKIPVQVKPFKLYKKEPKLKPYETAHINPDDTWVKNLPFNPASPKQRKRLFESLGLKVPRSRTGGDTIKQMHLRLYAKKFPVLRDIMAYMERQKIITSYDWEIQPDGRVHPEFGFHPSTWRKSARNPNIQTIPKRSDLAKGFRQLFVAAPGMALIECDSSAIEAVLVGYFAGSASYISLAKRGVHKFVAEKFAGRPVSKDEPLYDKIKRIVHMSNYLGGAKRIAEEYPDDFASTHEAANLQEFYFSVCPDIRPWQRSVIAQADYDHYLETPYLQRHYFYDALTKRNGKTVLGADAKRAVAFLPQATASAIQTEFVLGLPKICQGYLRAIIHDSIIMEVPTIFDIHLEAAKALYRTMTMPLPQLGGLSIGAECKVGPNLGEMKLIEWSK